MKNWKIPSLVVAALLLGGPMGVRMPEVRAQDATPPPTAKTTPVSVAWTPPAEESKRPEPSEWAQAQKLELLRPHALCTAQTLREWVRIACKSPKDETFFGVRVIGGPHDDVRINDLPLSPDEAKKANNQTMRGTDVVFPMRRGDRRIMEIGRVLPTCFRCYSVEETTEVVISALWLAGAPSPTIVVI